VRATPFSHEELEKIARGDRDQFGNEGTALSGALAQEVMYLREWMAYRARTFEAQMLSLSPRATGKQRREISINAIRDMRNLAIGGSAPHVPKHMSRSELDDLRRKAKEHGMDAALEGED